MCPSLGGGGGGLRLLCWLAWALAGWLAGWLAYLTGRSGLLAHSHRIAAFSLHQSTGILALARASSILIGILAFNRSATGSTCAELYFTFRVCLSVCLPTLQTLSILSHVFTPDHRLLSFMTMRNRSSSPPPLSRPEAPARRHLAASSALLPAPVLLMVLLVAT